MSDRAEKLDPLNLLFKNIRSIVYGLQRNFDEAIRQSQHIIDIEPNFAFSHYWLGCIYTEKRMFDKAIDELRTAIKCGGRSISHIALLGYTYARMGDKANLATRYMQEHLGISGEIERNEAFSRLMEATGKNAVDVTNLLWNTYNPYELWYRFAAIGIVSAISIFIYSRVVKRN